MLSFPNFLVSVDFCSCTVWQGLNCGRGLQGAPQVVVMNHGTQFLFGMALHPWGWREPCLPKINFQETPSGASKMQENFSAVRAALWELNLQRCLDDRLPSRWRN